MAGVFQAFMPDLVTLTGGMRRVARDGWHETRGTRRVARDVFQAQAGLAGGWQASAEWTGPNPIVERQSGGLVLVQFLAGKLCSLSLNGFSVHFLAVGCAF